MITLSISIVLCMLYSGINQPCPYPSAGNNNPPSLASSSGVITTPPGLPSSSSSSWFSSSSSSSSSSTGSAISVQAFVIVSIGQSNNQGEGCCFNASIDTAPSLLKQYAIADQYSNNNQYLNIATVRGTIVAAAEPMYDGGSNRANIIGNLVALGRAYVKATSPTIPVVEVQAAVSGTQLSQWEAGLEARSITAVNNIIQIYSSFTVAMFTWLQGESDSGTSASSYQSRLISNIIANSRTNTPGASSSTPFVIAAMVPEYALNTGGAGEQAIFDVHRGIPNLVPFTAFVNVPLGYVDCVESIHYSATGQRIVGAMYMEAYYRALANTAAGMVPNHPTGLTAKVTSSGVFLTWAAPPSNPTAPIKGYQVVYHPYINLNNPGGSCADGDASIPKRISMGGVGTTSFTVSSTLLQQGFYQFDVTAVSGTQISSGRYDSWKIVQYSPPSSSSTSQPSASSSTGIVVVVNNTAPQSTITQMVWVEGSTLISTYLSGTTVTIWPDNGPYTNSLTQTNPALAPVFGYENSSYPYVNFSGSQDMNGPSVFPSLSDYTVLAMFTYPGCPTNCVIIGSTSSAHAVYINNNTAAVVHSNTRLVGPTPPLPINTPVLLTFVWTESSTTGQWYINGAASSSVSGGSNTDNTLVVGVYNGAADPTFFAGRIYLVQVYNEALNSTYRSAWESYALAKYSSAPPPA